MEDKNATTALQTPAADASQQAPASAGEAGTSAPTSALPQAAAQPLEPFEAVGKRLGAAPWAVQATRFLKGWGEGKEVTQAEFEAAHEEATTFPIGYGHDQLAK